MQFVAYFPDLRLCQATAHRAGLAELNGCPLQGSIVGGLEPRPEFGSAAPGPEQAPFGGAFFPGGPAQSTQPLCPPFLSGLF